MSLSAAVARPPRCALVNVVTGEHIEALFNPSQLSEKVQVNYNRLAVPGLSHQPLQFQSTGNRTFAGLDFHLDRRFAQAQPGSPEILEFRAFLLALTVPPSGTEGVVQTAPPRTLIIWPGLLTVEAVLTEVEFSYRELAVDGTVLIYTASVEFEEILDVRVSSEERRRDATSPRVL